MVRVQLRLNPAIWKAIADTDLGEMNCRDRAAPFEAQGKAMLRTYKILHEGWRVVVATSKPRDLGSDRGYRVVMLAGGGSFRLCGADRSLGFAGEAEEDVEFDAIGEFDVFEEVEDAAAEAGADFADVAGEGGRSLRL